MEYKEIDEKEKKELRGIANDMRIEFGFDFDLNIAGLAIINEASEHKAILEKLQIEKNELLEAKKPIPEGMGIEYEDRRHKIERLRCLFNILHADN